MYIFGDKQTLWLTVCANKRRKMEASVGSEKGKEEVGSK